MTRLLPFSCYSNNLSLSEYRKGKALNLKKECVQQKVKLADKYIPFCVSCDALSSSGVFPASVHPCNKEVILQFRSITTDRHYLEAIE